MSIGLSALLAQRAALDTAGQNIANANTDGYARQRVNLSSTGGSTIPSFFSRYTGVGTGVAVTGVDRITDRFLQLRSLQEHANDSGLQQTKVIMSQVELAFNEPSDTGIQSQLADFWSAWDDVANNPNDLSARSALLEKAETVTTGFRQVANSLDAVSQTAVNQLGNDAKEINNLGAGVAKLNQGIQTAINGGLQPNDLLDQRDLLLQKLSSMIGITTQDGPNGMVDVYVGGTALVRAAQTATVHFDPTSPVALRWDVDNSAVATSGGTDRGLLQAVNVDIPKYRNALNDVATNFRDTVNAQHRQGVSLGSAPGATASNVDLIIPGGVASGTVDAANISVANLTPDQLAAAAVNGGRMDGTNARALAELVSSPTGPDQSYRSLVGNLGVDVQRANNQAAIQGEVTRQTDAAAQAVSGVNVDEEMTNMLSYQHAYEAAAKFISAVDETLSTLINMVR
jgi:flagellar hook-associated protein 1 FlgK